MGWPGLTPGQATSYTVDSPITALCRDATQAWGGIARGRESGSVLFYQILR
jgi:hypothetical protein